MESMANLNFAFRNQIKIGELANRGRVIVGLRSTSSIGAFVPCGMALRSSSCSIIFMMAGVAEPPNFALELHAIPVPGIVARGDHHAASRTLILHRKRNCGSGSVVVGKFDRNTGLGKNFSGDRAARCEANRVS